jgi:type IV pilus assembly protein PilB
MNHQHPTSNFLHPNDYTMIENHLLEKKLIDSQTLADATDCAKTKKQSLLCYLAEKQIIPLDTLTKAAAEIFCLPITDLSQHSINEIPTHLIPIELITSANVVPIKQHQTHTDIAMVDPSDLKTIDAIKFHTGLEVNVLLAKYNQISQLIKQIITKKNTQSLGSLNNQSQNHKENFELDILTKDDEPLVRFVNNMIENAINKNASDIHFEVYEKYCRVRFRQDGILHEITKPSKHIAQRLAARLKIMAKLDISERRLPQDGRCKIKLTEKKSIEIRVSSCPTIYGEKIVLRLLNPEGILRDTQQLGFNQKQQDDFFAAINKPQGLILVTGPTGSGKTVTLYAALCHLNTVNKNISTVEDPVEINLPGINQVNINNKAGLTFSKTLRAFLRQDPDIIMIGEIRDFETAEIAIKAAQTGHLVLSTLHTNSAAEAITRLHNMGVPLYNIASSIALITAQRLARKLCSKCKKPHNLSPAICKKFSFPQDTTIFKASNCKHCSEGYFGRIAIHETLLMNENLQDFILQKSNNLIIEKAAKQHGFLNLQQTGLEKVQQGLTSLEEIHRVISYV